MGGREFEDEFSTLRHDKPYTVSMANADRTPTGVNFSSQQRRLLGWTTNTQSSEERSKAWMSSIRLRMRESTKKNLRRISRFSISKSCSGIVKCESDTPFYY